ncbi:hypothetical protein Bca52824_086996 [Brassica carinata]|uniref:Uncharacterized protein n=1 Tax=Brassica carinata TaxID=52824 RepID=A0A8X7PAW5_BRACI|nr:hypothetical protein Bca52824_086996 [Brassica carinata]
MSKMSGIEGQILEWLGVKIERHRMVLKANPYVVLEYSNTTVPNLHSLVSPWSVLVATRKIMARSGPSGDESPPTGRSGNTILERMAQQDAIRKFAKFEVAQKICRPVKDLVFKDAYVDAARTKSDGSMNYAAEMYDTLLRRLSPS